MPCRQSSAFLPAALGSRVTEEIQLNDGSYGGCWFTVNNKSYDVAYTRDHTPARARFHHITYAVDQRENVLRAADILSRTKTSIDIGPTRHGITRGETVYFFDPSGNRLETFGGYSAYQMDPDSRPVTWTQDQIAQAVFYYAQELNETFLSVYT